MLKQNKNGFEFWTRIGFKVVKEIFSTIHPERDWKIIVMEKARILGKRVRYRANG